MKRAVLVALIASVALAIPTAAANAKKHKKTSHRSATSTVQATSNSHDVYVGGQYIGRDPDPAIRAYMMRSPAPWDGPD
jgi:hypothetical protein